MAFRDAALGAAGRAAEGPTGALAAAEALSAAAKGFRAELGRELKDELRPFLDERGRPEEHFRGIVRRMEDAHERRLRRAEREFLDSALLALTAWFRDRVAVASGADAGMLVNVDLSFEKGPPWGPEAAARAMGAVEEARADLADETNLNARLVLERLFLRLAELS